VLVNCALCRKPAHGYRLVEHLDFVCRYFALCKKHLDFVAEHYVVKAISKKEYDRAQTVAEVMES